MADAERKGVPDRPTSSVFVGVGVAVGIVITIVAFVADPDFGWPVLILVVLLLAATLAFRVVSDRGRPSDADSSDNIPRQEPRTERPLGDTPEAHDEINPHDLPLDHPGREKAEKVAGPEGTTRGGPQPGG